MQALYSQPQTKIAQEQLGHIKKKLTLKVQSLWKRSFIKGKLTAHSSHKDLAQDLEQIFNQSYHYKIDAIVSCAERIIEHHLEHNPQAILAICEKVLKNISEHTDVEITLNSIDATILNNSLAEKNFNNSTRNLVITLDEGIKRGSLIVKANKNIIDAHLDTQLSRAKAILLT